MPTLSEVASKELLGAFGAPFPPERVVSGPGEAVAAAEELGYPVVAKLGGDAIAHKTERGLVRLGLGSADQVREAADALLAAARPEDGEVHLLVAPMLAASRELIAGLQRDPRFGMTVMLGVGGVLAEAVADVSFRLAPLGRVDAEEMIDNLRLQRLLGPFRGQPAVDRDAVADVLLALSAAAERHPDIASADLNPLLVVEGKPVAVDGLVELATPTPAPPRAAGPPVATGRFAALFEPRGVLVAGASTHPGKFGFVSLHNILAGGYEGKVFATNRDGVEVLGVQAVSDVAELPDGEIDLVFVCTPPAATPDVLRACAKKGVTAAFVASGGYAEAGDEGRRAQNELATLAGELGMLLAGPNGQGVVSPPARLCAQIVGPNPPRGGIAIASQSGNLVSAFENYASLSGVGVSRAVSAGNAAVLGVADYLDYFAHDPETRVSLAYVESIDDGRAFFERMRRLAEHKPIVLLKGGTTARGQRAAASHTGALASDDRIFDGMCRQAGVTRTATVEDAFEAAASFACQPLPAGNRVAVVTTAGGWGVLTADALATTGLELVDLPGDLFAAIDRELPPRWSRNNPIDMAGGETRDTVPRVLDLVAGHPGVDAVIFLGMGIQSNEARLMRDGPFFPGHGLERIVAYHERQDARFAEAAAEASQRTGKPVLVATELAVTSPDNPGPATVRAGGRFCYPSANRAVTALDHLWRRAQWLRRRGLAPVSP